MVGIIRYHSTSPFVIKSNPATCSKSTYSTCYYHYQVSLLIGIFLLCWTPYAVMSMCGILGLAEVMSIYIAEKYTLVPILITTQSFESIDLFVMLCIFCLRQRVLFFLFSKVFSTKTLFRVQLQDRCSSGFVVH